MVISRALAVLACCGLAGCGLPDVYHCQRDSQCMSGAGAGRCEADGFCSFADSKCPNGWRYGNWAGPLSGECIGETDLGVPDGAAATRSTSTPRRAATQAWRAA
jgi:hypothetical protein